MTTPEPTSPAAESTPPLCGKTVGIGDLNPYRPCARPAGHPEAYCMDSTGDHVFLAASGVQPETRPVHHEPVIITAHTTGDLSPAATEALAALAAVAKRQILQDATAARPVPDTERRERYAAAIKGALPLANKAVDAAMSVADEEQRDLRTYAADLEQKIIDMGGHQAATEDLATENARLRAELEQARATTLTADEREFLTFALDLAGDEMASRGDGFTDEDQAALDKLRRMAASTPEAHPTEHTWAAELHDPLADEWVPGTRHITCDRAVNHLAQATAMGPTWKDGTPTRRRLVRATTTYTVVEPGGQAEDGAQPEREQRDCAYTKAHPTHLFMRMEVVFRCPGVESAPTTEDGAQQK